MADDAELQDFINTLPEPGAEIEDGGIFDEDAEPVQAEGIFAEVAGVRDEFSEEAVAAAIADGPALNAPDLEGAEIDPSAWIILGGLPGYAQQGIRAFGRPIFMNFPCFKEHSDALRRIGRDGLAEVRVLAPKWGGSQEALIDVIEWIDRHGAVMGADSMSFVGALADYHPRVAFAISDAYSFLLVHETRETGAPSEAHYVYAWPGGRRLYLEDAPAVAALATLCENVHNPVLERLPAVEYLPDDDGDEYDEDLDGPDEPEAPEANALPAPPEPVVVSAPVPSVAKSGLAVMREAGLQMSPSDNGPVLVGETSDGMKFHVSGADGKSLTLAQAYNVTFFKDEVPEEVREDLAVGDVLDIISAAPKAGMSQ